MEYRVFPETERARVAAGVLAWKVAVTARRIVAPERHWRHDPDVAGVYAAARLRKLVDQLVTSTVVAARVAGVPWYRLAEALGLPDDKAGTIQAQVEADVRNWRTASDLAEDDYYTPWWAAALADWYNGKPASALAAVCDVGPTDALPIEWTAPQVAEPDDGLSM